MTSSPNLLSALESFVSLSGSREQAIASNMANVDTPGYHVRDIDFDHELKKAMNASMMNTSFDGNGANVSPATFEVKGLMERPDGNNVDLDREGMMLAQTQLQHQMGIALLKSQFHGLLSAINGGN